MRVSGISTTAVPVEFIALDGSGAPVVQPGTFTLGLRASVVRDSDGFGWDFAASAFAAVPSISTAALTEYSASKVPGLHGLVGGWVPPADDLYTFTVSQVGGAVSVANVPLAFTLFVGPEVGASTMGTNLVDELAVVADSLRDELHADMGVRQFRCYIAKAKWSGGKVGVGSKRITYVTEIVPSPRVVLDDQHSLTQGGVQETGTATLTEISLTYSQAQLLGEPMAAGDEFFYLLTDRLGQGLSRRVFIPQDHPWTDREQDIGWMVKVRRVDTPPLVVAHG